MDTSDTSDFESADEFLSDNEDTLDNKDETVPFENNILLEELAKIKMNNKDPEIPGIQKSQQCYGLGLDYHIADDAIFDNAIKILHKVTDREGKNEDEQANIVPEYSQVNPEPNKEDTKKQYKSLTTEEQIPRIETTCWVPALNEAYKKNPTETTVDRDGNSMVYQVVENLNLTEEKVDKFEEIPKDFENITKNSTHDHEINESNLEKNTAEITQIESILSSLENQLSENIRTTCWIPELNEVNIDMKQRMENEKYPPKPPTVDRDGNPIMYNTHSNQDHQIITSNLQKNTLDEIQIETTVRNSENQPITSEMNIKTSCWIPELNEVNIDMKQRMENEKYPPKPPTVDRDGNSIYKLIEVEKIDKRIEKTEGKGPNEEDNNLWTSSERWEDHEDMKIENKTFDNIKSDRNDEDGLMAIGGIKEHIKEVSENQNQEFFRGNNDQWEVAEVPDLPKHHKLCEKGEDQKNLWKDDLGSWGDDDTWISNETTFQKPPDSIQFKLENQLPLKADIKQRPASKPDSSISSDDNMWENDTWESIENDSEEINKPLGSALDHLTQMDQQGWSKWGNWGISSVLNTVTQGFTAVIGVPNPEDLARQQHSVQKQRTNEEIADISEVVCVKTNECSETFVGLGTIVSGVTKLVETTGTKVISGGLGTLETIGKKTMEVLQENDPGLKKKRAFLKIEPEKTVLSQVLREAKEKSERSTVDVQESAKKERKVDYEIIFDDYQGLVHMEALAMLSRQCSIKLTTILSHLSGLALTDLQETLDQVKELCELPDDSIDQQTTNITPTQFRDAVETAVSELGVAISFAALVQAWEGLDVMASDMNGAVYRNGVETLARFTALAVEQMHRAGELLLVKERRSTVDEADSLVQISSIVIAMLNTIATLFTERLNGLSTEEPDYESNQYITNIFFEMSNSTQYIRQAFQLLIPVLQVGAS